MNVDKITKQIDNRIVGLEDRKFSNASLSIQNKGRLNALSDLKNWIIEQEQHSTWIKDSSPQTSEQPLAEYMSELTEKSSPTYNQVVFDIKERAKKSSRLLYISQSLSKAARELLIEDGFKLSQFESSGTSIRW